MIRVELLSTCLTIIIGDYYIRNMNFLSLKRNILPEYDLLLEDCGISPIDDHSCYGIQLV